MQLVSTTLCYVNRALRTTVVTKFSCVVFDAIRAAELVHGFTKLTGQDRARVHLALERFERSLRRQTAGDAALELSIALESLLGDGGTELTWKVGLRSALLVDGSHADRTRLRAMIQSIYSLRSALAHTGTAPAEVKVRGVGKLKAEEIVKEGTSSVSKVIAAAITR
jgi:hypothetical protein